MPQYTQEYYQKLYDGFETTQLFGAVEHVDVLRQLLSDGPNLRPPQIRDDLHRLHQLTMDVVNQGQLTQCEEMFNLAFDIEAQLFTMLESVEAIRETMRALTDLAPDPDEDYEEDEDY